MSVAVLISVSWMASHRIKKRKKPGNCDSYQAFWNFLAERTGLEPATPGVTGRYSNQLNYRSAAVAN